MKKKSVLKYTFANEIRKIYLLNKFRRKWSKENLKNDTLPNMIFDKNIVEVGDYSYGELNVVSFDNKTKLKIGKYVSIAQNVTFLLDVEHYTNHIMTYPFKSKILLEQEPETFSKGDIVIEDDVWIGYGATIISGVNIGKGAIVAAGALVTKDVQPYSIVGGVPAQIIKKRFSENIIQNMDDIDLSKIDLMFLKKNIDLFYEDVNLSTIEKIKKTMEGV